jgi:protein-glutamine gamma-glutamyltransferase
LVKGIRWRELASAAVWACATWVATFFVSLPSAAGIAAAGGFVGYLIGCWLSTTRVRVVATLGALGVLYLVLLVLSGLLSGNYLLASTLGAENAFTAAQWVTWGGRALLLTCGLRFLSGRQPALISAEILTVTLLLASPLAAHREGYINRPHFLVDPLWSQNMDPVPVLFALGGLAAGFLVVLQNGRRTRRASTLDLLLLFAVIGILYAVIPDRQLLDFDIRDPLGMGKKQQQQKKEEEKRREEERQKRSKGKGKGEGSEGGRSEAEEMELDNSQDEQDKPKQKPVAIVLLRDDYTPPYGYYYFRQTAFSQYNGKRLVADTTGRTDQDLLGGYPTQKTTIQSTVPLSSPYHRRLNTFVAMITGHTKPFTLVDGRSAEPADNPNPSQFVRAYEVESLVLKAPFEQLFNQKAGDPSWNKEVWTHYTQYPDDKRYQELAQKCVQQLPQQFRNSDFARAVAVKLYLDKTVTYTMKANHVGMDDPVAHYLFEDPRGYCVHQAHAAVYLWRSLGLPARVGAGYATDARNRGNGSAILLRSGEAHAWPEVYLDGVGWTIVDISPEKADGGEMEQPDPNLQRMLGEMARQKEKRPDQEQFRKRSLQEMLRAFLRTAGGFLLWGLGGALVGAYLYKFYRRFEPLWCSAKRLPVAALRSGLDQLAEVGATRRYGEGRLDFARRLGLEALEPLTHFHLGAVMGKQTPTAKELLQVREQLHQQIARRYAWWKRMLGFINPLSWWNSK